MPRIARKLMAHFINAASGSDTAAYERLGKGMEEYSPELSANVETKEDICGNTDVIISGYTKTGSVEPYYAEKGSALFLRLQKIIDDNLVLDDLKADVVEVHLWEEEASGAYPAIKEDVYIEVSSYGGDTTGYQIPFTLHYTGVKTKGTFNPSTRTFTPTPAPTL